MVGVLTARLPFPGPRRAWDFYCFNLQKRPVLTKSFTSLLGFAIGDAVAQLSNRPSRRDRETQPWGYDTYRTVRLAAYGTIVAGPLGHFWFGFLDSHVFATAPKSPQAILSKIVIDQSLMTPFGTALFFAAAKLMDMQPGAVIPTIQEKLMPTCMASIKLWPAAHAINFAFIPSSQRILYINVISIFWTMLLSQAASSGRKTEAIAVSPPQLVVVPVLEDEDESLASVGFLEEMEALETEYDKDL